jgi:hypothetical protein
MNERIKELLDQALKEFMDKHEYATVIVPDSLSQKFTQLIVRECIDIVKPTDHHEVWAQSYLGGVDGLDLLHSKIKDIKEHFGVTE